MTSNNVIHLRPHDIPRKSLLLIVLGLAIFTQSTSAQEVLPELSMLPAIAESEGEILLQGPVHEAFATPIAYDPTASPIILNEPPEPIDELPPEFAPEGESVIWIPGYWAWDEERADFIWISGLWRSAPPDREWAPGYWFAVEDGYQWIPGAWLPIASEELVYYPEPPISLEQGPNVAAPSPDYLWSPGVWVYVDQYYRWRPGSWILGRAGRVWTPSCYRRAARGYLFIDGYWDYEYVARGRLFAPVYFHTPYVIHTSYHYSPRIVVHVDQRFMTQLFVNVGCNRYHFGDYYGAHKTTYRPCYDYHANARGYSPCVSYNDWRYGRQGVDYVHHLESWGRHYQSHPEYRPPRTWSDQQNYLDRHNDYAHASHAAIGSPIGRNMGQHGSSTPSRMTQLNQSQRNDFSRAAQEIRGMSVDRHRIESAYSSTHGPNSGQEFRLPNAANHGPNAANRGPNAANRGPNAASHGPDPASRGPGRGGLAQNGPSDPGLSHNGRLNNGTSDNGSHDNEPLSNGANDNRPPRLGIAQNGPGEMGPQRNGPGLNGPEGIRPGQNGPGLNGPEGIGPGLSGLGQNGPGLSGPEGSRPGQNGPGLGGPEGSRPGQNGPGLNGPSHNGPDRTEIAEGPTLRERLMEFRESQTAAGSATPRSPGPGTPGMERPSISQTPEPGDRTSRPDRPDSILERPEFVGPLNPTHVRPDPRPSLPGHGDLSSGSRTPGSGSSPPSRTTTPREPNQSASGSTLLERLHERSTQASGSSSPPSITRNPIPEPRPERTTPVLPSRARPETPSFQRSTPLFQGNNTEPQPRPERTTPNLPSRARPTTPSPQRSTPLFQGNSTGPQPRPERSTPALPSRARPTTPSPPTQRSGPPSSARSSGGGSFGGGNVGPPSSRGGGGAGPSSGPSRSGNGPPSGRGRQ